MQGVWLENGQVRFRRDLPSATAANGECVVRVDLAGICGTDIGLQRGYAGFTGIPGHEFVGTVVASEAAGSLSGRRVVADINLGCGTCVRCVADGHGHHCSQRTVAGIRNRPGAFATHIALPVANLVAVPDELDDAQAALAEPLAAALHVLDSVNLSAESTACVMGAGRLGTLIAWVLYRAGIATTVVVRSAERLAALPDCQVATELSGQFDLVVECTGSPDCLPRAIEATAPGGTVVMKSTYEGATNVDMSAVVVNEISLVGSRCGDMSAALAWLAAGHLPDNLPHRTFGFEACQQAFAAAQTPGQFKVFLSPPV